MGNTQNRPRHLQPQEVYQALTPALPRIFSSGAISVQMIMNVYRQEHHFFGGPTKMFLFVFSNPKRGSLQKKRRAAHIEPSRRFASGEKDDLFCAFALARVAAAMRVDHLERALGLFDLARRKVKAPGVARFGAGEGGRGEREAS